MFSGIVEAKKKTILKPMGSNSAHLFVERPQHFEDLKPGDSICVNGICLTLEKSDDREMRFYVGPETLQVTGWELSSPTPKVMNLERSLKVSDRIHGHFVLGHVDTMGEVVSIKEEGDSKILQIEFPATWSKYLWSKGSVAVNGVSLTINHVTKSELSLCLIPETLARTNLCDLEVGQKVSIEVDPMARAFAHQWNLQEARR